MSYRFMWLISIKKLSPSQCKYCHLKGCKNSASGSLWAAHVVFMQLIIAPFTQPPLCAFLLDSAVHRHLSVRGRTHATNSAAAAVPSFALNEISKAKGITDTPFFNQNEDKKKFQTLKAIFVRKIWLISFCQWCGIPAPAAFSWYLVTHFINIL